MQKDFNAMYNKSKEPNSMVLLHYITKTVTNDKRIEPWSCPFDSEIDNCNTSHPDCNEECSICMESYLNTK